MTVSSPCDAALLHILQVDYLLCRAILEISAWIPCFQACNFEGSRNQALPVVKGKEKSSSKAYCVRSPALFAVAEA